MVAGGINAMGVKPLTMTSAKFKSLQKTYEV